MKNILFISFMLLFVSCYKVEKPKKPDNLIAKDKMVSILIDMSVLNSAKGINKKVIDKKGVDLQQYVFNKHKIDSAQFSSSNHYYTYQIDDYKDIYTKVKDSLKQLKDKYTAIVKKEREEKKRIDSVKIANKKSSKKLLNKPLEPAVSSKERKVSRKPK